MPDDEIPIGPLPDSDGPSSASPARPRRASFLLAATLAGLVAGLVSWSVGEFVPPAFVAPVEPFQVQGRVIMKPSYEAQASADYKNTILGNAILGSALGACLGVAGGVARRSTRAAGRAGAAGMALGGSLAAGASAALLLIYFRAQAESDQLDFQDLTVSLIALGGPWAVAGLGGGLAFGFGLGRGWAVAIEAGIGGLLGGFLGAVLYLIGGTVAFPSSKIALPIPPDWPARMAGSLLVATLAGLVAALLAGRRAAGAPAPPPRSS